MASALGQRSKDKEAEPTLVSVRTASETANTSYYEYFDRTKVEVVSKPHRIDTGSMYDCDQEWFSIPQTAQCGQTTEATA